MAGLTGQKKPTARAVRGWRNATPTRREALGNSLGNAAFSLRIICRPGFISCAGPRVGVEHIVMTHSRRESHLQRVVVREVEQPTAANPEGLDVGSFGQQRDETALGFPDRPQPVALIVPVTDSERLTPAAAASLRIAAALIAPPQQRASERLTLLVQWRKKPTNPKNPMRCAKLWHFHPRSCRG